MGTLRENVLSPRRGKATLTQVMKQAARNLKVEIRTQEPASIIAYNPATQRAEVALGVLAVRYTEDGEQVLPTPVVLTQIPVKWMGTKAGYLTFPIVPGDKGFLQICDRSIERWSKDGIPRDPGLRHTHNLIDGTFYPTRAPKTAVITPPTSLLAAVLEGPLIKLGATAIQPVVQGTTFLAAQTTYTTAVTVYTTAVAAAATAHALTAPPTPVSNGVFIVALGAATAVLATATGVYAATFSTWLSPKVFV